MNSRFILPMWAVLFALPAHAQETSSVECPAGSYPWLESYEVSQSLANRISVPRGYERAQTRPGTFQHWLRHVPLKPGCPPVRLYDGRLKANQGAHVAVVDIDVGDRDLQQCADAVIRLRAEFLYSRCEYDSIRFNFTSGDEAPLRRWMAGHRPAIDGSSVRWTQTAREDSSYASFREYLELVFTYAGTYSLRQQLRPVGDLRGMTTGDVFIRSGFPGHAVLVVDMAIHGQSGRKLFLLAQSYMPAQEIHILNNPVDSELSPWYEAGSLEALHTPEWTFNWDELTRF